MPITGAMQTIKPANLKDFDLRIGDIVIAEDMEKGNNPPTRYEVISIHRHIFRAKKCSGFRVVGYPKVDYQRGFVRRAYEKV